MYSAQRYKLRMHDQPLNTKQLAKEEILTVQTAEELFSHPQSLE